MHIIKGGGCNGIGAWICNSVLNGAVLLFSLNFYVKMHLRKRGKVAGGKDSENLEVVKAKDV